jgi:hypothetical protein
LPGFLQGKRSKSKSKSYSCNRPWSPVELSDVKDPPLSRQSAHRWQ